jgi:hypothetical protein
LAVLALATAVAAPVTAMAQDGQDDEAYDDEAYDDEAYDDESYEGEGDEGEGGLGGDPLNRESDFQEDESAEAAHDSVRFDLHAGFTYYLAVGLGLRVDLPVVPEGLLDGTDEDIRIGLGVEAFWFFGDPGGIAIWPLLAFQWNFYLNDRWSIFPELGGIFMFMDKDERGQFWKSFIAPLAGFGVRYHFNERSSSGSIGPLVCRSA